MEKQSKAGTAFIGGRIPSPLKARVRLVASQGGLKLEHILKEALEGWLKRKVA